MSTPLLEPYHFALVAHSITRHGTAGRSLHSCGLLASSLCEALRVPVFGQCPGAVRDAAHSLAFDLQRMNAAAYGARYGETPPAVAPARVPSTARELTPAALLKACDCIRYNCDGGHAIGDSFKAALETLAAIREALREHIIQTHPDYDSAQWFLTPPAALA